MDTPLLGSGDGSRDLAAGDWRRHWRLSCWGIETTVETTLETQRLGSGEDSGDWGLETAAEIEQVGI